MVTKNMTEGNITKHLLSFALPMILGNLFQLTYNAVDSIILGRFAGENALASVGTANPVMNIVIFFIIGICNGASVLLSEFYGSEDKGKFHKEFSTSLIAGIIFSLVMTGICIILAKPILLLLRTPQEILTDSVHYLQIIFLGLIFTFIYNIYAASLRSVGDTKTPLIFLMISSVLNGLLDLYFIGHLKMGVVVAAYTTIFAEAVSAISCIIYVWHKVPILKLKRQEIIIDRGLLMKTINYSWASAMQQTTLYVGKVFIQGAVNPLGIESIAAFNAVNRVDDFAFTPEQSIGAGITTYVAQNRGAGKNKRILKGLRTGLILENIYGVIIGTIIFILARPIMSLFLSAEESYSIVLGALYLTYMAFFYIMPANTNGIQGFFRGMGQMNVTWQSTFVQMLFRVLFAYALVPYLGFAGIALACLGGWVAMLIFEVPKLIKQVKLLRKQ
ncbi:MAG: MATE family efflux transporter [Clostridiales bacterium]|nr:MATE family efflux transporter [Clostridiales bacterium]